MAKRREGANKLLTTAAFSGPIANAKLTLKNVHDVGKKAMCTKLHSWAKSSKHKRSAY
jgi:hypothetical protein